MAKAKYQTPEYRAAKAEYRQAQAQGQWLVCVEQPCLYQTRAIPPTSPVEPAHDQLGVTVMGPAHRRCNRSEGAARGNRMRGSAFAHAHWNL